MGGVQRWLEEIESRGWSDVDRHVCSECVTDEALRSTIRAAAVTDDCDYCGEKPTADRAVAPVNAILDPIVQGLRSEYEDPVEQVLYSSADGGYQMPMDDTADLLWEHPVTESAELLSDLIGAIGQDAWVQRDPYAASPSDALEWGWRQFREFVKHRRRYTFLLRDDDVTLGGGEYSMDQMPLALAEAVTLAGQVRTLTAGSKWWRVRPHPAGETYATGRDIGTPPDAKARDNRMSPKGIGAFYGASTSPGARSEVAGYADPSWDGSSGSFELLSDITVVDLSEAGAVPSLYDEKRRHLRAPLRFMQGFVEDVALTAHPSADQDLEYVPTQVVAEVFRYSLGGPSGAVRGVLWKSAKDPAVVCCVIFARNDEMTEIGSSTAKSLLALDPCSVTLLRAPL